MIPCRSTSPDGEPCSGSRGHARIQHRSLSGRRWEGGINTSAVYARTDNPENRKPAPKPQRGAQDHYTEADYQTWLRL